MRLIDEYGLIYRLLKKNDKYLLAIETYNSIIKKKVFKIEIIGKENIKTFIKNNKLIIYKGDKKI